MAIMGWKKNPPANPFEEFDRLQSEMGRLFSFVNFPDGEGLFDGTSSPPIDVLETQDDYVVIADLPGLEQKDIELSIASNVLSMSGEKKQKADDDKRRFFREESWTGNFRRTISLPNTVDPEKVSAELKDGVLCVKIGKKAEVKPRQIAVNVA
jgi:HSP20 family protein